MDAVLEMGTYFHKGGTVMYFLLLCSFMVMMIGVERYLYFRAADSGSSFSERFSALLREGDREAALHLSDHSKGDTARILGAALRKRGGSAERITAFMETEAGIAAAGMRKRLYYLSVVVTLAPLLGLLGTISGMISSFSVFNLQAGEPLAITEGIGEALIATATGLCVAIFALIVHSYFVQRVDTVVTNMERCFSALSETLEWRREE